MLKSKEPKAMLLSESFCFFAQIVGYKVDEAEIFSSDAKSM
ncbi:hypothetical protein NSA23_01085 [Anaerosalibacter massiliensis]|uniref:Uncharacterized protein n=1 Tax=Anaerosalibacter massiliensis TaxID=1347392 RepID=A0A9X2MFG0_9FIRM|nr:hypothetical protein [Anaerosalibacter massiliensis]MCR2042699.1 hypothetical protein [Anaerosalibacter massiliensis]